MMLEMERLRRRGGKVRVEYGAIRCELGLMR